MPSPLLTFPPSPAALSARATRFLARAAFDAGALDPITWEFIHDEPQRADECSEFVQWLSAEVPS